jgi:hypothetical protein
MNRVSQYAADLAQVRDDEPFFCEMGRIAQEHIHGCIAGRIWWQSSSRSATLRDRVRYALRWLYWAIRHRSTKHVAWILEYEGYR